MNGEWRRDILYTDSTGRYVVDEFQGGLGQGSERIIKRQLGPNEPWPVNTPAPRRDTPADRMQEYVAKQQAEARSTLRACLANEEISSTLDPVFREQIRKLSQE